MYTVPSLPLIIPGTPLPKNGWKNAGGVTYVAKPVEEREALIRLLAQGWWRGHELLPRDVPIIMRVDFLFGRPQSYKGGPERAWCIKGGSYPDADNCMKLVNDGLQQKWRKGRRTSWGIFENDSQVAASSYRKLFAGAGEEPCTIIQIELASQPPSAPQIGLFG